MRWLLVHPGPEFSVHDVFAGWREALTDLGETVAAYNMNDRLRFYDSTFLDTGRTDEDGRPEFRKALTREQALQLAANGLLSACYQYWPDVILLVSAFFTPPSLLEIIRARPHTVVIHHTESPYQDGEQLERAALAHINLLNDPVNLPAYAELGPAEYMPHAYRPTVHYPGPGPAEMECDFVFSGTGYDSRIRFFEALDLDGLVVNLAGNWVQLADDSPLRKHLIHDPDECLDNDVTANLYRAAKAGINFYRQENSGGHLDTAPGWAMGPREVEQAACGLWFLRDPRGESDEVLPMLPTFDGPEDASEQLRWWLCHDQQREHAAATARSAVAGRTFEANAKTLLRMLGRQRETIG